MIIDKFKLDGRVALVTGSSGGIGEALAHGLAEAGATVVINGRDATKAERVAQAISERGLSAGVAAFDVTDAESVDAAVAQIEAEIGPIDILVNNAGIQRRGELHTISDETWSELMRTNLDAPFRMAKSVVQGMISRGRGSIINICSVNSELGRPSIAPYSASKGAIKMLTKGMAIDWGKYGIRINGLGPGYFKTELNHALYTNPQFSGWLTSRTPLGRWGDVEELQGACVFLASDAASFMTGHILYVDGGVTASL